VSVIYVAAAKGQQLSHTSVGGQSADRGEDLPTIQVGTEELQALHDNQASKQVHVNAIEQASGNETRPLAIIVDRIGGHPALPTNADLILVGEVKSREAHLDPQGAKTTLTIQVASVLKGPPGFHAVPGSNISVLRFGANVQLPSGKTVTYRNYGERMPQLGKHYLLFLSRESDSYGIITGYELQSGRVTSLDDPNARPAYRKYNGGDEAELMSAVTKQ